MTSKDEHTLYLFTGFVDTSSLVFCCCLFVFAFLSENRCQHHVSDIMSATMNDNHNKPLVLCMDTHQTAIKKAVSVFGWTLHIVGSVEEGIQALHNRSYEAMIVGIDTNNSHACSPLLGYACRTAPAMFRIVYSSTPLINWEVKNSCFACGADAVVNCRATLVQTLCSLVHFESIVPVGTKIAAASASIYATYDPLRRRQQREDQLISIAKGVRTVRVKQLMHYTLRLERQLQSLPTHYIQTVRDHNGNHNKHVVRMVHVSDTNNHHRYLDLPLGDLFVHSGNFTNPLLPRVNAIDVFDDFLDWMDSTVCPKFGKVVFIAGNHDDILDQVNHQFLSEHLEARQMLHDFLQAHPSVAYLENTSTTFRGLKIYGSPTVYCHRSNGFERDLVLYDATKKENLDGIDIFLTNRAPSILHVRADCVLPVDHVYTIDKRRSKRNCPSPPRVHAFGHCNKNFGIGFWKGTLMMNGSQERLHSLDKYGGGTPLVIDIPLPDPNDTTHHTICGPHFPRGSVDVDRHIIDC